MKISIVTAAGKMLNGEQQRQILVVGALPTDDQHYMMLADT